MRLNYNSVIKEGMFVDFFATKELAVKRPQVMHYLRLIETSIYLSSVSARLKKIVDVLNMTAARDYRRNIHVLP